MTDVLHGSLCSTGFNRPGVSLSCLALPVHRMHKGEGKNYLHRGDSSQWPMTSPFLVSTEERCRSPWDPNGN